MLFIPLLLLSCSYSPQPVGRLSQSPAPQSQTQVQTPQEGVPALVLFETSFDLGKISEDGVSAMNGLEFVRCQFENAGRVRTGRSLTGAASSPARLK